jgi:hypothetical protein
VVVHGVGGCADEWMYVGGRGLVDASRVEFIFRGKGGVCACGRGYGQGGVMHLFNTSVKCLECCERRKEG